MNYRFQSQAFEYVTDPILEVEDIDTRRARRESINVENEEPIAKKSKMENQGRAGAEPTFNKDSCQRMLVNSTYAGLEDLLVTKVNAKKHPSVLYANAVPPL